MAKKKKQKEETQAPKVSKSEIRAYYKANGWRKTISNFGIAPKDLSPIVNAGGESGPKKKVKAAKVAKAEKAQTESGAKKGKKKKKKEKGDAAPYGLKKDGTPRKPPGRKAGQKAEGKEGKADKPEKKRRGRPPKDPNAQAAPTGEKKRRGRPPKDPNAQAAPKKDGKRRGRPPKAQAPSGGDSSILQWLLAFRKRNPGATIDTAIVDLSVKLQMI